MMANIIWLPLHVHVRHYSFCIVEVSTAFLDRPQTLYTNSYCQHTKYMAMYTYQTSWHMEVYNIHSIIRNSRNVGKLNTCANSRYHALFSERGYLNQSFSPCEATVTDLYRIEVPQTLP